MVVWPRGIHCVAIVVFIVFIAGEYANPPLHNATLSDDDGITIIEIVDIIA